jgi:hypothetical protein
VKKKRSARQPQLVLNLGRDPEDRLRELLDGVAASEGLSAGKWARQVVITALLDRGKLVPNLSVKALPGPDCSPCVRAVVLAALFDSGHLVKPDPED